MEFSQTARPKQEARMFKKIMAPVDLAHQKGLAPALQCAADLAAHYQAEIVYVGVVAPTPGPVAHSPKEFAAKLAEFAAAQASAHGIASTAHAEIAGDPTTEVDDALLKAVADTGADLVVMASHVPGIVDAIWPSNGGKIASHAKASVMLVRL